MCVAASVALGVHGAAPGPGATLLGVEVPPPPQPALGHAAPHALGHAARHAHRGGHVGPGGHGGAHTVVGGVQALHWGPANSGGQ